MFKVLSLLLPEAAFTITYQTVTLVAILNSLEKKKIKQLSSVSLKKKAAKKTENCYCFSLN